MQSANGATLAVDVWLLQFSHSAGYGNVSTEYRLYVTDAGEPVKLDMWGRNWFSGGHWDHYIADFYAFEPEPHFPPGLFNTPEACNRCTPRCAFVCFIACMSRSLLC